MTNIFILTLITVTQLMLIQPVFALTPAECRESGDECFCIAFPGAETICSQSRKTVLTAFETERD